MICQIWGCETIVHNRHFCAAHWKAIPLKLRQEYWKTTDMGRATPAHELLTRINEAIKK
jgi:hypothetical protein